MRLPRGWNGDIPNREDSTGERSELRPTEDYG